MPTTSRSSTSTKVVSMLMSIMLAMAALTPWMGGSQAYADPGPYTPPEEITPGYAGPLTWVNHSAPKSFMDVTNPFKLVMDHTGNTYITRISPVHPNQGLVQKILPDGEAKPWNHNITLTNPLGITMDAEGSLYVIDNTENKYTSSNVVTLWKLPPAGEEWEEIQTANKINYAFGLAADRQGNIYAVDSYSGSDFDFPHRILKLVRDGDTWKWDDITQGKTFDAIVDIAVDGAGNIFVNDLQPSGGKIYKLSSEPTPVWSDITPPPSVAGPMFMAQGIGIDPFDNLIAANIMSGQIVKLGYNGGSNDWKIIKVIQENASISQGVFDVATDDSGYIYGTNIVSGNVIRLMATIKYDGNGRTGGTVPVDNTGYTPSDFVIVPSSGDLVNNELYFAGWNTSADGSGQAYQPGAAINMLQSITLYAQWSPTPPTPSFTVTYTAGLGGTIDGSGSESVLSGGHPAAVPTATPDPGYTFVGWSSDDGETILTADQVRATSVTGNISYAAIFQPPTPSFAVTYTAGPGGIIDGSGSEQVLSGGHPAAVPTATPDPGYTFLGWSSDSGETILTADQVRATTVTGNISYVAIFQAQTATVTLSRIELDSAAYTLNVGATHQTVTTAVYSDNSTKTLASGVTYSSSNTNVATVDGTGLVTALAGGQTVISAVYEDKQAQATVTVNAPSSPPSSNPSTSPDPEEEPEPGIEIIVDGVKQEQLATARKDTVNGRTVTTIVIDSQKVIDKLERENNKLLTIPLSGDSHVVVGELTGSLVKALESKDAQVQIVTDRATYTLPASMIGIDSISSQLGTGVSLADITVRIVISESSDETAAQVQTAARQQRFETVGRPVDFEVTASYGSQTVQANQFNGYVVRQIALPDGVDAGNLTTGVVLTADGELFHVPTVVVEQDGKLYAQINSLTNSTYSVIYNPREMDDVKGHWANADVNDMTSRLIMEGVSATEFRPDEQMTRAEFAAIVTRGLGIQASPYAGSFTDVAAADWYAGAAQASVQYELFAGYEDGSFRPNQHISRQEAAAVLSRATGIADIDAKLSEAEMNRLLAPFTDGSDIAAWARPHIAAAVSLGIVNGRGDRLDVDATLTRAEAAALVRRFLQAAQLINA